MKNYNSQAGFSVLEALLIVTVLGIVGFTGWFVYNSKQATDNALNATGKSSLVVPKKTVVQTKPTVDTTKYLVLQDLGVKLPLPAGLEDAYAIVLPTYDANYKTYGLGALSLTKLDKDCAPDRTGTVHIGRQSASAHDANSGKEITIDNPVYPTKIGNYYYQITHAQAVCSTNDATNQIQMKDAALFKTAFDGIKAIN